MGMKRDFRESIFGRPNTIKTKLSIFNNHIGPWVRPMQKDDFVKMIVNHWKEAELAPATIKSCLSVLNEFCLFAYKEDINKKRIMFEHFSNQIQVKHKVKVWSPEEVKKVLSVADVDYPELATMMRVFLMTGLRRGELLALTWNDIDFLMNQITISKSLDLDTMVLGPTKTKKTRIVPMSNELEKLLQSCYTIGENGRCFRAFDPNDQIARVAVKAGVAPITVHGLRHTFATTLLNKPGISPIYVKEILGHSKLTTTLDIYYHWIKKDISLENMYEEL